jgi:acetoin utilization deacetylase AcuC-like enzyme
MTSDSGTKLDVGYAYDDLFHEHDLPGHPEHADRLRAVMALLRDQGMLDVLTPIAAMPATFDELCELHDPAYVSRVYAISEQGGGHLGPDTYLTASSFDAAALAAGAAMRCVDAVLSGARQRAFALVRPPGHHAFAAHGEGFCLFNNVAFAARRSLGDFGGGDAMWSPSAIKSQAREAPRAMIVDFDVHHGNGTQSIFYDDARVFVASLHQYGRLYPGSGALDEVGAGPGRGGTLNVPLPAGAGDRAYALAFERVIAPAARRFKPDLLLVSAGFDAHWRDPLAGMSVSLSGFAAMARALCALSDELCGGRLVTVLEGGYDLQALSYGVANMLCVMRGDDAAVEDPLGPAPVRETDAARVIDAVREAHGL